MFTIYLSTDLIETTLSSSWSPRSQSWQSFIDVLSVQCIERDGLCLLLLIRSQRELADLGWVGGREITDQPAS